MSEFINDLKIEFNKVLEFFKRETASLRIGRASPALVENLKVEAYSILTPLIQLASIQMPDPRSLVIQPWDRNLLKDVEKAISASDLGINPVVDNNLIRLNFPPLTEERRKEVVKKLHQKMEETRVSLRNQREKIKEQILDKEKNKELSEDEKFRQIDQLDELVKEYNSKIKEAGDQKEKEIMSL